MNLNTAYKLAYKTKEVKSKQVSYREFREIFLMYIDFVFEQIFNGETFNLPVHNGKMYVKGTKQQVRISEDGSIRGLAPDWSTTKEVKSGGWVQPIFHTNEHSDGVRYRLHWSKKFYGPMKKFYNFRLTRAKKRTLASEIKNNNKVYI